MRARLGSRRTRKPGARHGSFGSVAPRFVPRGARPEQLPGCAYRGEGCRDVLIRQSGAFAGSEKCGGRATGWDERCVRVSDPHVGGGVSASPPAAAATHRARPHALRTALRPRCRGDVLPSLLRAVAPRPPDPGTTGLPKKKRGMRKHGGTP